MYNKIHQEHKLVPQKDTEGAKSKGEKQGVHKQAAKRSCKSHTGEYMYVCMS